MKSRYEVLLVVLTLAAAELVWYESHADQAAVDAGVDFAKSLVNGVQNLTTTTNLNTVPGYRGTALPQVNYYHNQDVNSLQTDAVVNLNTGNAPVATQYAYDAATRPKLQFSASDPILSNSSVISSNTLLNPDVLTVKTGHCAIADVAGVERRVETCTAWMQPTYHDCNKNLDVRVTWNDVTNCTVGGSFAEGRALINSAGVDDYVYARAYCNPGTVDAVSLQVDASDGDPGDCTSWTDIIVSDQQTHPIYVATLRPRFTRSCTQVPVFVVGGCTGNNCIYNASFKLLNTWNVSDGSYSCQGTPENLVALGYTGALPTNQDIFDPYYGYYCVFNTATVQIAFERPTITRTPTVNTSWVDGCAHLEAQVR